MNTRWKQSKITYKAQGRVDHDPRNLVFDKSHVLQIHADHLKGKDDDETAWNIFKFVKRRLTYQGDMVTSNAAEFWQNPEATYGLRQGDCEDGAILIMSLMAMAGIPAWKRKVCAGWVQNNQGRKGGHAYAIYFREKYFDWFVLDWCYYPSVAERHWKAGVAHRDHPNYLDIWFTFNEQLTWAQKDTRIKW